MQASAAKPMIPSGVLSFEDGQAQGGAVLYEESEKAFKGRVRELKYAQWFLASTFTALGIILLLLAIAVVAARPLSSIQVFPVLFGLGMGGFLLFVGAYLLKNALRIDQVVTRTRIYERGLSLGWLDVPYIPLERVYSFESSYGSRRQTPYCVLTHRGGRYLSIAKGPMMGDVHVPKNYDELHSRLAARLTGVSLKEVPWDEESRRITSTLMSLKGPVRAKMERIALAGGRLSIDREFLRTHWHEVNREMLNPIGRFKAALKKAEKFDTLKRPAQVE